MSSAIPASAASCTGQNEVLHDLAATRRAQAEPPFADVERLLSIARDAGMLVLLDAQIGRERYQSVTGSVTSLQRFASALAEIMQVPPAASSDCANRGAPDRSQRGAFLRPYTVHIPDAGALP